MAILGQGLANPTRVQDRRPTTACRSSTSARSRRACPTRSSAGRSGHVGGRRGAQHTIDVTINGKPYIIHVDEAGSGRRTARPAGTRRAAEPACVAVRRESSTSSDETKPTIVSKLMLETHDPKNCAQVAARPRRVWIVHLRQPLLQRRQHATTRPRWRAATSTRASACSTSAIRCGSRRSPTTIRRARPTPVPGRITTGRAAGWPVAPTGAPRRSTGCRHRHAADDVPGQRLLILKFTNGVWPFPGSTTPPGLQN